MFAGIFTNDPELIDFAATAIRIYCGAMFVFGVQLACQLTFVATGNAPCSIIVAVVRKFVLLIPLIYIMPLFMENKAYGVYLAEPVADFFAVTFTAVLFFVQFRKALRGIEKQPETRYLFYYNGEKQVIFEPDEDMVKILRNVAPRKVFID